MPLVTALGCSLLSLAILLAKANHGLMRILVLDTFSSKLAFRLILAILTLSALVGLASILISTGFNLSLNQAVAIVSLSNIIIFAIMIWFNTFFLQKLELEQMIVYEQLKRQNIDLKI